MVLIRTRKPWVLFLFRRFGWNVLFMLVASASLGTCVRAGTKTRVYGTGAVVVKQTVDAGAFARCSILSSPGGLC